jgi:hypothetical protein
VSGELKASKDEKLDEVSQMEARSRRVETAVVADGWAREKGFQFRLVGRHVDEAAPDEFVPNGRKRRVVCLCSQHVVTRRHAG